MTSLLAAALKYAGEHLPVFPCVPASRNFRMGEAAPPLWPARA